MYVRKAFAKEDFEDIRQLVRDTQLTDLPFYDSRFNETDETYVFMVEDEFGNLLGTNSLTIDGAHGLPVDDDFKEEVDLIRKECRKEGKNLGMSWRIVTRSEIRNQMSVTLGLIGATIDLGRQCPLDVMLFILPLKQKSFYECILGLKGVGEDHSVILMRGDKKNLFAAWNRVRERRQSARMTMQRTSKQIAKTG
ncbi:MAG: hypothetical protein HN342_13515 [Nitrospina sp.]|jgi:hypothetical protein|nr:hypothetical protein [Nitrospina sp.]